MSPSPLHPARCWLALGLLLGLGACAHRTHPIHREATQAQQTRLTLERQQAQLLLDEHDSLTLDLREIFQFDSDSLPTPMPSPRPYVRRLQGTLYRHRTTSAHERGQQLLRDSLQSTREQTRQVVPTPLAKQPSRLGTFLLGGGCTLLFLVILFTHLYLRYRR